MTFLLFSSVLCELCHSDYYSTELNKITNMRKLNLLVDKLSKNIKAGGEIENLEEGACSTSDKEDSTELMCWVRTTRQIMMDIGRLCMKASSLNYMYHNFCQSYMYNVVRSTYLHM